MTLTWRRMTTAGSNDDPEEYVPDEPDPEAIVDEEPVAPTAPPIEAPVADWLEQREVVEDPAYDEEDPRD